MKINYNTSEVKEIAEECKKIIYHIDYSRGRWKTKFSKSVKWDVILYKHDFSINFIEFFFNVINKKTDIISPTQNLTEEFIEKHINELNWKYISTYQNISEDFIEKHKKLIHMNLLGINQKNLSEKFIEKYINELNWKIISTKYNKINTKFIEKYKDKIDFYWLFHNKNISNEFILNNVQWFIDKYIKYSWRFKNKKFKNKWDKYKKLFGK